MSTFSESTFSGSAFSTVTFPTVHWPLSAAQRDLWLPLGHESARRHGWDDPVHAIAQYVDIQGSVDLSTFRNAVEQAVAEAECLHLRFTVDDDQVWQHVSPVRSVPLTVVDLSDQAEPLAAALTWMRADTGRSVELINGPLYRHALLVVADDRFLWYYRTHNIVLDDYGCFLLNRRVADLYSARTAGRAGGEPFGSLRSVIDEDARYTESAACSRDRAFWTQRYADAPVPVSLADLTVPATGRFLRRSVTLPPSVVQDWSEVADRCGTSWSTVVIATVASYLRHVTGVPEVVLGLPRMCRRRSVSLNVPCSVANIVPLRVEIAPDASLREVSRRVADEVLAVWPHERYRSEWLRHELHSGTRERRLYGPVVNVSPISYELWFGDHRGTSHPLAAGAVHDLTVTVHAGDAGADLRVDFDANPAMYTADDLTVHLRAFLDLLDTAPTRV